VTNVDGQKKIEVDARRVQDKNIELERYSGDLIASK
jgi:hypothetical protein